MVERRSPQETRFLGYYRFNMTVVYPEKTEGTGNFGSYGLRTTDGQVTSQDATLDSDLVR